MFKAVARFAWPLDTVWIQFRAFYWDLPNNLRRGMPSLEDIAWIPFSTAQGLQHSAMDWTAHV